MPTTVLIPTPLRPYTGARSAVDVDGANVGELLRALIARHGDLKAHLYHEDGRLRHFVNIYLNDEDIRYLEGERTPVTDTDTVSIVPSVAGGSTDVAGLRASASASQVEPPKRVALSSRDGVRYSRHLTLPEVGVEGQERLKAAKVVCVGAGGLGSPAALYLAAAGVGTLGLVDFDVVDESNLQRQILYDTNDVGRRKLVAARDRLVALNPDLQVITHETPLLASNALDILRDYDVIVDGADNFPTRYLVNDACVLLGKPNVYGSIFRFEGQASIFATKGGPCYRCLYPEPPPPGLVPSCAEGGVLGVLPGIIGTIQATEAIKLIIGAGQSLVGRLMLFDALDMGVRFLKLRRDPNCAICGDHPTVTKLIDYEQFCGVLPASRPGATGALPPEFETTVEDLSGRLKRRDHVWILDVREPREVEICRIEGSHVIPLNDLPKRLAEIPQGPDAPDVVIHCKMGGRSTKATNLLREHGFTRIQNLKGGILAWIEKIDPTLTRY